MSWRDFFVSRHTLFVERELEELKKTHAEALRCAKEENASLREELERTRAVITPAIQYVETRPDNSPQPFTSLGASHVGLPFARVVAKYFEEEEKKTKEKQNAI